jgi:acyl-CoA hydrolase
MSSHLLARLRGEAADVLGAITADTNVIVPLAAGEPRTIIDAIDDAGDTLERVRIHQMHALYEHPYLRGVHGDRLRHVSYFLSPITRPYFQAEAIDLVPCHFSEVPLLLGLLDGPLLAVAAVSPPDRHGYFTLGTNSDYVSSFIGRVPFFVEVNPQMPMTSGGNQLHISQVAGWCEADYPLVEVPLPHFDETFEQIGKLIAERVPDGATVQAGIGAASTSVLAKLGEHRDLGVHTEVFSDPLIDLIESGVVTGVHKARRRSKHVATFALGTRALYDFIDQNHAVELLPVDWVNDPRVIAQQPRMVSINSSIAVDFLGQCASETIGGRYWSGSGGQADFARGAMYSEGGQGFVALPSTAQHGQISRIVATLDPGAAVTTMKNTVDKVCTEFGVAELRGKGIRDRVQRLIAVAHPDHRDELRHAARAMGYA